MIRKKYLSYILSCAKLGRMGKLRLGITDRTASMTERRQSQKHDCYVVCVKAGQCGHVSLCSTVYNYSHVFKF